jgi:hypothetical protein
VANGDTYAEKRSKHARKEKNEWKGKVPSIHEWGHGENHANKKRGGRGRRICFTDTWSCFRLFPVRRGRKEGGGKVDRNKYTHC